MCKKHKNQGMSNISNVIVIYIRFDMTLFRLKTTKNIKQKGEIQ